MTIRTKWLFLVASTSLLALIIGCGSTAPNPNPTPGTPKQDPQATIAALARAAEAGAPTPTPVPAEVRSVAVEFAKGQLAITRDLQQLHSDFDKWRAGLTACDATSAQVALRQFAGRAGGMAEAARGLPRLAVVRELADQAIGIAEKEEEAFRSLRDTWQPNRPSVFDQADMARSTASAGLKEADDRLRELDGKATAASRAQVDAFAKAFQRLNADWDKFHKEYDAFRGKESKLSSAETASELSGLVGRFRDIVIGIRDLPAAAATQHIAEQLAKAAADEDLALRKLRGSVDAAGGAGEPPRPGGGPAKDSTAARTFDAFEAQLVKSNAAQRLALQLVAAARHDTSEESAGVVKEFARQHGLLVQQWNAFHKDYDDWRRTEGGCDRGKAVETLGRFSLDFGKVADRVRGLPRAPFLRPLGETLVEAAEREERAMRTLRNTWHPFNAEVYKNLDQERTAAGRLRRQAAVGIQDFLDQFRIPSQEIGK